MMAMRGRFGRERDDMLAIRTPRARHFIKLGGPYATCLGGEASKCATNLKTWEVEPKGAVFWF